MVIVVTVASLSVILIRSFIVLELCLSLLLYSLFVVSFRMDDAVLSFSNIFFSLIVSVTHLVWRRVYILVG